MFAAVALAADGLSSDPVPVLLALGFAASSTRCFGWEAANIWTLEVFPTEVRATAVAVTQSAMRVFSVATISTSSVLVGSTAPTTCLMAFSSCLCIGGALAIYLPKETANSAMEELKMNSAS